MSRTNEPETLPPTMTEPTVIGVTSHKVQMLRDGRVERQERDVALVQYPPFVYTCQTRVGDYQSYRIGTPWLMAFVVYDALYLSCRPGPVAPNDDRLWYWHMPHIYATGRTCTYRQPGLDLTVETPLAGVSRFVNEYLLTSCRYFIEWFPPAEFPTDTSLQAGYVRFFDHPEPSRYLRWLEDQGPDNMSRLSWYRHSIPFNTVTSLVKATCKNTLRAPPDLGLDNA